MRHTIKSWRNYRCLLATTALVAVFPATAFAAPDDAAAVNEDPDAPAEIVVSARKQNESALEVPIALSAFSESVLQDRLATGIADVADFTPGFQMQQSFGRGFDRPIIRGASNIIQADGKVGIFLNGAPYLGDFSSLDLAAVQQIEVIKGPQSAVFGRGTLSGAINVTLKRPGDKLEGKISATMGNYERREISGFVSAPVLPGVGIQVGAKSYDIAGQFVNSAVPGERLGDQNTVQYTAGVYLDPAPDLSANVLWLHQRDRDGMYAIGLQTAANNNCYLTTRPYYCGTAKLPQSYAINSNKLQYPGTYRNADRFIGDVNWDIVGSGYNLSFQVGYSDVDEVVGTDQTYDGREFYILGSAFGCSFVPLTNQLCSQSAFNITDGTNRKTQTYELRLSSPASQRLRWRIGGFVSHDKKRALTEWLEATELGLDALADTVTVRNQAVFGGIDFDVSDT
ncbi:MAG TPA: TonB-dependent receptor plug domain-containing protein, partial [Novosphingobium sp.]|nr:TonB-dependent receptor plug domain-containing protein [Novosphingobium sp.]